MKAILKATTALVAAVSLLQPALIVRALADDDGPLVHTQPFPGPDHAPFFIDERDHRWHDHDRDDDDDSVAELLREKIKYVFVIFNENHSFDNEYGTFPGANGIYSDGHHPRPASATPGFTQTYTDLGGNTVTVQPFLLGPQQNSTFRDSVDHSHTGLAKKIDVVGGVAQMDQFSLDEYSRFAKPGNPASQAQGTQFARLVMSHIDCDTIPFFWRYASRFTLFDNIFATEDTPSTPNAVAMIAGQSGETQWVKHPSSDPAHPTATGTTAPFSGTVFSYIGGIPIAAKVTSTTYGPATGTTQGPPLVNDPQPWWGSVFDTTVTNRQPNAPKEFWGPTNIASNLTFASVPLTLMGKQVTSITGQDLNPAFDLPDIGQDIVHIHNLHQKPVAWHWYQNGYDQEPNDATFPLPHTSYVSHHQGPQYFGYLANNPALRGNFRGEGDFFTDLANHNLPRQGGVFYIRGGYYNLNYPSQTPPIQNPNYPNPAGLTAAEIATINITKSGDDDHPSYSDSQLSEAMAARVINAIAKDEEIWEHSAIIITYDESDGFWDHVPPRILSYGPDSLPLSRGVRIPMILISPYARVHAVSHAEGDHNAVIETINAVFHRPALSQLPDEAQALAAGNSPAFNQFAPAGFEQKFLGPRDTPSPITSSLLSGFDPARLRGELPPLPPSYAMIPDSIVESFPHYGGNGCNAIGIVPEDKRQGIVNQIPPGFNSLPATLPAYN
jgi:phospholipase C